MYLTINPACVLNWHLRILAIRPVPGGAWVQCHYVVGQEAIVGCHIRLVLKTLHLQFIHALVLNVYVRMFYVVNYLFSFSFLIVHRWVPTLKQPGRSQGAKVCVQCSQAALCAHDDSHWWEFVVRQGRACSVRSVRQCRTSNWSQVGQVRRTVPEQLLLRRK